MARLLTALILLMVPVTAVLAAGGKPGETVQAISLKYADARQLAAAFGGDPGPLPPAVDPEPARRDFAARVRDAALDAAKPAPETMREAGLYLFAPRATAEVLLPPPGYRLFPGPKPEQTGGGFRALLPDDLTQGPVAFIDDNSLIVRGTPEAIDEFREIVALLDKPVKRVRLSVRLVTLAAKADPGLYAAAIVPPEPPTNEGGPTGSAVVPSNAYAVLRTGLAVPFVVAPGEGQPGGYRTDAAVDTGELVMMPRVNADSSVSLFVGPTDQLAAAVAGVGRLDQATRAKLKDVLFK